MPTLTQTIQIQNPKTLSVSYAYERTGDLRVFKRVRTVSLTGYLFNVSATGGVDPIVEKIEEVLINYFNNGDYVNVVIDGSTTNLGRLESLSFSQSDDIRNREYSCAFSFATNPSSSDDFLSEFEAQLNYIKSVSEDVSVSLLDAEIGNKEFSHSVNISFSDIPDANDNAPFAAAKALAASIFGSDTFILDIELLGGESLADKECNEIFTESYNSFTYDCSFTKKLGLYKDGVSDSFKKTISHTLDFDSTSGVATVTENVNYTSSSSNRACYSIMEPQMMADFNNSYGSCAAVYGAHSARLGLSNTLTENYFRRSFNFDQIGVSCGYSVSYSDDLFYKHAGAFWSYVTSTSGNKEGIEISEAGEIVGIEPVSGEEKSEKAITFWKSNVRDGIQGRCEAVLPLIRNKIYENSSCSLSPSLGSSQVTCMARIGRVSYNYTWVFSPSQNANENIKSKIFSCVNGSEIPFIPYNENYLIPNAKEIKSISPTTSMGIEMSSTITIEGEKLENEFGFSNYLSEISDGDFCLGDHVSSATYSYSPNEKRFAATVSSVRVECK